jgi:hypothetical protein
MPMDSISMCSNTLYMSNVDVGSSLSWLSDSTMTLYHHFDSRCGARLGGSKTLKM